MSMQKITTTNSEAMNSVDLETFIASIAKQMELENEILRNDRDWMLDKKAEKYQKIKKMYPFLNLKNDSVILTGFIERIKYHVEELHISFSQVMENIAMTSQHCQKLNHEMLEQQEHKDTTNVLIMQSYYNVKAEFDATAKEADELLKQRDNNYKKYWSAIKKWKELLKKETEELEEIKLNLNKIRQIHDDFQICYMMPQHKKKSSEIQKYFNLF